MNKNIYFIEIGVKYMPSSQLKHILDKCIYTLTNEFNQHKLNFFFIDSLITIRRIVFIICFFNNKQFNITDYICSTFYNIKFNTNMRWNNTKHTFIRPVCHYSLTKNNQLIQHTLFNIKSSNRIIPHKFFTGNVLNININTYKKFMQKKFYVILDFQDRLKLLKTNYNLISYNKKLNILLHKKKQTDIVNSFEYPSILFINFNVNKFKIPNRIIILTLLDCDCVPFIKNNLITCFSIIIDTFLKNNKKISQSYKTTLYVKLSYINTVLNIDINNLKNSKLTSYKSLYLNKNFETVYNKIKRCLKLIKLIHNTFNFNLKRIKHAIILLNFEIMTKTFFETPNFHGILFASIINNKNVSNILYDYNRILNNNYPKILEGGLLVIIETIDAIIKTILIHGKLKGKKDPFNIKGKISNIITVIIKNNIYININTLIKNTLLLSKCNNILMLNYINKLFIDRSKFIFYCKYINYINYNINFLILYYLAIELNNIFLYTFNLILIKFFKRINNIIIKTKLKFTHKFNIKLMLKLDEKILFNTIIKHITISKILYKKAFYFEYIKFTLYINNKLNNFFKTVFILDKNLNIKYNRLKLLFLFYRSFLRTINFKNNI